MKHLLVIFLLTLGISLVVRAQVLPGGFHEAFVEGNVLDGGTGKPIVGAKIDVVGTKVSHKKLKANNVCGYGFALSSTKGNFSVGVGQSNMCVTKKHPVNGSYLVTVSKRGYLPQQQFISLTPDSSVKFVNFVLQSSIASIQVSVTSDGKPVPYAEISVMKNVFGRFVKPGISSTGQYNETGKFSAKPGHMQFMVSSVPVFRSDESGHAGIPVSPGDYEVIALKAGYKLTTKNPNPLMQTFFDTLLQGQMATAQAAAQGGDPAYMAMMAGRVQKAQQVLQPGVFVHVVKDQTIAVNLSMTRSVPEVAGSITNISPKKFVLYPFVLSGESRPSQNNVLFFTPEHEPPSDDGAVMVGIVRSKIPLGTGSEDPFKAQIKTFNFSAYGWPDPVGRWQSSSHGPMINIWSFTDSTGTPGATYYYYITEVPSPSVSNGKIQNLYENGNIDSNYVTLTTH